MSRHAFDILVALTSGKGPYFGRGRDGRISGLAALPLQWLLPAEVPRPLPERFLCREGAGWVSQSGDICHAHEGEVCGLRAQGLWLHEVLLSQSEWFLRHAHS